MKNFTVKMNKIFTNDQIAGILCTAFEGGMVDQWAQVVGFKKPEVKANFDKKDGSSIDWHDYRLYSYPLGSGGKVTVLDTYENKKYILNRASIQKGLQVMAEKFPRHFNDFVTENDDAITGDVFLQCCLLEDVVYG